MREYIIDVTRPTTKADTVNSLDSITVVYFSFFKVPQDFVGFGSFFEFVFGGLVALIPVGVLFHGDLAIRLFDLSSGGGFGNPGSRVIFFWRW